MSGKDDFQSLKSPQKFFLYRVSQLLGFLLGMRFTSVVILAFALYVSTFFLFNREESLRKFVFDFKVHGIIFCTILSILAGGIINQFYDREKDRITKPLRTKIQSFLEQKYFLYAYLSLNLISLGISVFISRRVFIFLVVYQFVMWFYSHKISKILILNNLTFVALTLYPFFGMLVYYGAFSMKIFLMALFLFLILLIIDILKDALTKNADKLFGYSTIPNVFDSRISRLILIFFLMVLAAISVILIEKSKVYNIMNLYFEAGLIIIAIAVYLILSPKRVPVFVALNLLKIWIFIGIIAMLLDGIFNQING
ncbi:MAG: UbiA family prenyltransferase [Flavobacteriaceae bacterium]|jgi:4-hydroxybenzoate polyprenyltransferase|nr:UbiA family prenyltransferase [Flavobacteriaceae bacterium]